MKFTACLPLLTTLATLAHGEFLKVYDDKDTWETELAGDYEEVDFDTLGLDLQPPYFGSKIVSTINDSFESVEFTKTPIACAGDADDETCADLWTYGAGTKECSDASSCIKTKIQNDGKADLEIEFPEGVFGFGFDFVVKKNTTLTIITTSNNATNATLLPDGSFVGFVADTKFTKVSISGNSKNSGKYAEFWFDNVAYESTPDTTNICFFGCGGK